jgi:hypothetical protein
MALFVCAVKVYPERGALGLWDFFTGNLAKLHPVKLKKTVDLFWRNQKLWLTIPQISTNHIQFRPLDMRNAWLGLLFWGDH